MLAADCAGAWVCAGHCWPGHCQSIGDGAQRCYDVPLWPKSSKGANSLLGCIWSKREIVWETNIIVECISDVAVKECLCTEGVNPLTQVAERLEKAVSDALHAGYRTADLYGQGGEGLNKVGCSGMGEVLAEMVVGKAAASNGTRA